ncbi:Hypothetical predicted protein [Cloeon dipterum]|uniref:C-type lectin domain-containing protein n=1 Tax=Cloeon dipterum TaxID=197152 RepID=A0A8S1DBZ2_9INSE|nr:Hypothetical predicted protein [Cloeon dipterum]
MLFVFSSSVQCNNNGNNSTRHKINCRITSPPTIPEEKTTAGVSEEVTTLSSGADTLQSDPTTILQTTTLGLAPTDTTTTVESVESIATRANTPTPSVALPTTPSVALQSTTKEATTQTTTLMISTATATRTTTKPPLASSTETASTTILISKTTTTPTTTTTATLMSTTTTTTTTTTASTTVPPCIPYICKPDATKLDAKGLVDPKAVTNGVLRPACDRLYLFSTDKKAWADAASQCCTYGMSLITVESWQRLSCISDLMNSGDGFGLAGEYLTSLSDYQKEGSHVWCNGNNTMLGNLTWNTGEPSGQEEDCGSIQIGPGPLKSNVINDANCASTVNYLCEVPITTTTKPPCLHYTCEKKASYLDTNDFIDPSTPIDGKLRLACNRMYFFSDAQIDSGAFV